LLSLIWNYTWPFDHQPRINGRVSVYRPTYVPDIHLMTSRGLTSGFDSSFIFLPLPIAAVHLPTYSRHENFDSILGGLTPKFTGRSFRRPKGTSLHGTTQFEPDFDQQTRRPVLRVRRTSNIPRRLVILLVAPYSYLLTYLLTYLLVRSDTRCDLCASRRNKNRKLTNCVKLSIRQDHPHGRIEIKLCVWESRGIQHSGDRLVLNFKFRQNRLSDFGVVAGRNSPVPITLAKGLYNSLYYRTSRDVSQPQSRRRNDTLLACVVAVECRLL